MKILVTGGTGVVGRATVTELLRRKHEVRLLSRHAEDDVGSWAGAVEPFPGDVGAAERVHGAAEGCAAVLHIVGIVEEKPPDLTFERINVEGTRHVMFEAERAGVQRFVFVSSLGADRGESAYHRSKLDGEHITCAFQANWTIARLAPVIGPRDVTVSMLLRMMRTLPAVPVIDSGDQPFQPVWHEDAAWALAECLERNDLNGVTLPIAGPETITVNEVLDVFAEVTGRSPLRIPLPAFLVQIGSSLADIVGLNAPVSAATIQMLLEGSYLRDGEQSDIFERFGGTTVPLRARLIELADEQPEQTPERGVGKLKRHRFSVDLAAAKLRAPELLHRFRDRFAQLMPFEAAAEPGAPARIEDGATLTLELPVRSHVQIRVEHIDERSITLATIAGHPLAGIVRFEFEDRSDDVVRFVIDVFERPASRFDQISMAVIGGLAQRRAWFQTAHNVARLAGVTGDVDVSEQSWNFDDLDAEPIEGWIHDLIQQRERAQQNRS